jgi:hypothetical protein
MAVMLNRMLDHIDSKLSALYNGRNAAIAGINDKLNFATDLPGECYYNETWYESGDIFNMPIEDGEVDPWTTCKCLNGFVECQFDLGYKF